MKLASDYPNMFQDLLNVSGGGEANLLFVVFTNERETYQVNFRLN